MKNYTYEELFVGQEESFQFEITERHMAMFGEITGDFNPLHTDAAYAGQKGFQGKVVYGMLTASFLSTLAGMYLPGRRSLIHEVEVKFTKAHYPDLGPLTLCGKLTDKQDTFKRITIKVRATDSAGETVLRGTLKVGVTGDE